MKNMTHAAVVGAMAAALAACGGGGDSGGGEAGPAVGIAGFYTGSMSITSAPAEPVGATPIGAIPAGAAAVAMTTTSTLDHEGDALALVLDSGEFFVVGKPFGLWNVALQGTLALGTGSTLSSTNAKVFGEGSEALTVASASYVTRDSVTASLQTTGLDTFGFALDDFSATTPTLATLSAIPEWSGNAARSFSSSRARWGSFTVNASGVLTSSENYSVDADHDTVLEEDCVYSGRVSPVKGGYTLRVTFGTGCHWSGQTVEGWLVPEPGSAGSTLRGIILKADRSEAEIVEFFDSRTS